MMQAFFTAARIVSQKIEDGVIDISAKVGFQLPAFFLFKEYLLVYANKNSA